MKEEALESFQKSFDLLNESIPDDKSCQFLELKRTLPEITNFSNESVENINLVDAFFCLNDELLEDMLLIQEEKGNHVKAEIHKRDIEIRALKREQFSQNENIMNLQSEIEDKKNSERKLNNDKIVAYRNAENEENYLKAAKRRLDQREQDMKSKRRLQENAKRALNSARAEKARQYSKYKSAERSYNYHKRQHEKKLNNIAGWLIPGYNIYHAIDTLVQYEGDYRHGRSNYQYYSRRYDSAYHSHRSINSQYYMAVDEFNNASEQERQAQAKVDTCHQKITGFIDQVNKLTRMVNLLRESVKNISIAKLITKRKKLQAEVSQVLLKRQIVTLNAEVSRLLDGKRDIINEMVDIGKMKESVVGVQSWLQSVDAGLRNSQSKRESPLAEVWTFEDFEEAVEEVFIGIKDAITTMISEPKLLADLGIKVTSSAKRMKTTIRNCETKFGSSFPEEDVFGLE